MKNSATINKTLRLANSRIANEIEPIVYADFKVTPDSIDLMETRYAVVIRGIEVDITNDVKWTLDKVMNRTKREQVLDMVVNELSNDEVFAALEEDELITEKQEA